MKDFLIPDWLDRGEVSPNYQRIRVQIRHLHCPNSRSRPNIQYPPRIGQRREVQMPVGKKHDYMMFDIQSLQFSLQHSSLSAADPPTGLCSCWDPRTPSDIARQDGLVERTSSLGSG